MSETTPRTPSEDEYFTATSRKPSDFEKAAAESQSESLASEFLAFLAQNKKWWLAPIVIVMLLLVALMVLSSTAAAPFIYTLF
jgi:uncharacterized integral membrane protein